MELRDSRRTFLLQDEFSLPFFGVIGLGSLLFPIDQQELLARHGVEKQNRFRHLPASWKVLCLVAIVAGAANYFLLNNAVESRGRKPLPAALPKGGEQNARPAAAVPPRVTKLDIFFMFGGIVIAMVGALWFSGGWLLRFFLEIDINPERGFQVMTAGWLIAMIEIALLILWPR